MGHGTRILGQVRQATALLEAASRLVSETSAEEAVCLARAFAKAEKVAMAGTRRAVLRAGDDGARRHGGERDMVSLAAQVCGTTAAKASKALKSARALDAVPTGSTAFLSGALSLDQAEVVAEAAAAAPSSAVELLAAADRTSLTRLRAQAAEVVAARRGEEAAQERERRLAARRFCRIGPAAGGGVRVRGAAAERRGISPHGCSVAGHRHGVAICPAPRRAPHG